MTSQPSQRARLITCPTCPAWVLARLHEAGLPAQGHDQRRFSTTGRAVPYWHGTCGQPIITGTAWPRDILLDPTPTTPDGELLAILTGRATVQLYNDQLWRRNARDIALTNANQVEILIEHSCTGPPAIPNSRWAPKKRTGTDIPPF